MSIDLSPQLKQSNCHGRFKKEKHRPLMAMVEITSRCNMACPVCFAGTMAPGVNLTFQQVQQRLHTLLDCSGPIPLQISGGEPTLHPDLAEIISYAQKIGFRNIELVTNGIKISNDPELLNMLARKGLTAVYLQFDGLSRGTYLSIRGIDMTEVRLASIAAIRQAGLCCTLAVAVIRNVNDHELGNIVRFALQNIDTVRAINFQAATRFTGRFEVDDPGEGYSVDELIDLVESQLDMEPGGFLRGFLGHKDCNALSMIYDRDGKLKPLFTYLSESVIRNFLGDDPRQVILDLFMGKERFAKKYLIKPAGWRLLKDAAIIFGKNPDLYSLLKAQHLLLFAKSFMGRENYDCDRLQSCCYGLVTGEGVYSFCVYNNFYRFPTEES